MENGDPITAYRQFLESFSNKIDDLGEDELEIPFRLSTFCLVPSEVEGECLEWTRRYLSMHECPVGLLPQLSRAVYKNFHSSVNLADFYVETDDVDNDNDDDLASDDSSEDDKFHNSHLIQLSANKLLQEVVSFVHSTVKTWRVVPPVLHHPPTKLHVCAHAIKNTRRKMEDRHVIINDFNALFDLKDHPSQSYFAVFDGHGGLEAADYAATHLHGHLVADDHFATDPAQALKQAYKATDIRFLEKAKRERLRSGTTGVSVFIRDSKMYVGWLGDSQALLVRGGLPIQIMNPHKPEREDERQRIEELGGCVLFIGAWRVNGNISVSRAIGDAPHKPFISSDADVTTILMTGEEEYMVLACDGLWDVLSPSRVTQIVHQHSISSPGGLDDVAIALVNAARDVGSSDNISVIVVFFKSKLSKPQVTEESGLLLSFKDVSSNNFDQMSSHSSSTGSTVSGGDVKMNERLKNKPGGEGEREFLDNLATSIKGSSIGNYHSNSRLAHQATASLNSNGTHGYSQKSSSISSSYLSNNNNNNNNSSSSISAHSHNHHQQQQAVPANSKMLSSSIHETPFSHELMRQALFYICKDRSPREDSQLVALALSKAMRGEKQAHRRKSGSVSEKGKYARQGRASKSPRRPSVRPLSRVNPMNSPRTRTGSLRGGGGGGGGGSSSSKKKFKRKKKGSNNNNVSSLLGETMWTSDEDDIMSVRSAHVNPSETATTHVHASWHPSGSSGRQATSKQFQSWRVEPSSLQIQGSTASLSPAALNLSRNVPGLLGRSLPLGSRTKVLPGISSSSKYLSSSLEDVSRLGGGNKKRLLTGMNKKLDEESSSSFNGLGLNSQNARPTLGRGYSVMSDSYAIRRTTKVSALGEDFNFETSSQYGDSRARPPRQL